MGPLSPRRGPQRSVSIGQQTKRSTSCGQSQAGAARELAAKPDAVGKRRQRQQSGIGHGDDQWLWHGSRLHSMRHHPRSCSTPVTPEIRVGWYRKCGIVFVICRRGTFMPHHASGLIHALHGGSSRPYSCAPPGSGGSRARSPSARRSSSCHCHPWARQISSPRAQGGLRISSSTPSRTGGRTG
jgi:hypothetical protein